MADLYRKLKIYKKFANMNFEKIIEICSTVMIWRYV